MNMKNKKNKIILGGGIAGLLYAFYNPEYILITDKIGGHFSSNFQTGPKYIHVDKNTTKLLKDLGLYVPIKKIKVGYFYNDILHDENTEENRKLYFKKTRGETTQPYSSIMSSNKKEFEFYDINLSIIIDELEKRIKNNIIIDTVSKIDIEKNIIFINDREIQFSNLISTIPQNIFLSISNKEELAKKYKSFPTTFILIKDDSLCPFKDFKEYDYVYISEEKYPFHRITKTKNGLVFEYKGDDIQIQKNEIEREVLKIGQIVENDTNVDFKNISFFGRYGCWKHKILINDLLKEIYSKK